jgi:tungstate transport system ATP-binding protein
MFDRTMSTFHPEHSIRGSHSLISASDLTVTLDGKTLLDIPSIRIDAGGPTIVMGPNGAGKSLLLRLLHGLVLPSRGSIFMQGEPLDAKRRRRQAMVFQSPVILRRSVRANVEFALAAHGVPRAGRRSEAMRLLTVAGLQDKARQSAPSLSGGERQKLTVVRALATRPEVLFLDEPTSNLDPASVMAIENLLMNASAEGTKIVLVTHDIGQAGRLGEEVLFLHQGQVTEQTSLQTFTVSPKSQEAAAYLSGELLI